MAACLFLGGCFKTHFVEPLELQNLERGRWIEDTSKQGLPLTVDHELIVMVHGDREVVLSHVNVSSTHHLLTGRMGNGQRVSVPLGIIDDARVNRFSPGRTLAVVITLLLVAATIISIAIDCSQHPCGPAPPT